MRIISIDASNTFRLISTHSEMLRKGGSAAEVHNISKYVGYISTAFVMPFPMATEVRLIGVSTYFNLWDSASESFSLAL